jgi:putative ABC transport system permease protein
LFGLRIVARRPRRALLTAANMAVSVTGLVAAVAFHTSVEGKFSAAAQSGLTSGGLSDPVIDRDMQMLTVITVMIVMLSLLNALFTTWATVLDARRASATMRAIGARVQQVTRGLVVAQMLSALPGAIVGVGLGLLLFKAAVKGNGTLPSVPLLLVVVIGTLMTVAVLTTVPAQIGVRQSVSEVLSAESP